MNSIPYVNQLLSHSAADNQLRARNSVLGLTLKMRRDQRRPKRITRIPLVSINVFQTLIRIIKSFTTDLFLYDKLFACL